MTLTRFPMTDEHALPTLSSRSNASCTLMDGPSFRWADELASASVEAAAARAEACWRASLRSWVLESVGAGESSGGGGEGEDMATSGWRWKEAEGRKRESGRGELRAAAGRRNLKLRKRNSATNCRRSRQRRGPESSRPPCPQPSTPLLPSLDASPRLSFARHVRLQALSPGYHQPPKHLQAEQEPSLGRDRGRDRRPRQGDDQADPILCTFLSLSPLFSVGDQVLTEGRGSVSFRFSSTIRARGPSFYSGRSTTVSGISCVPLISNSVPALGVG